jgi:hypothetical protein
LLAEVAVHETVALPEPVTLLGVIVPQTRPDGAVTLKMTVPLNPFTAVTVTVELVDWPTFTGTGEEAIIEKSWTRNIAVVECVIVPLVPVTVST